MRKEEFVTLTSTTSTQAVLDHHLQCFATAGKHGVIGHSATAFCWWSPGPVVQRGWSLVSSGEGERRRRLALVSASALSSRLS
jgi:hypothetical protein